MNPKERLLAALRLQEPDMVPTMEIDFQLHQELLGDTLILGEELASLRGAEKTSALNHNIDLYIETAERLDYSAITVHPVPTPGYTPEGRYYPELEDEVYVIGTLARQLGDMRCVAAGIDGTFAIPDGREYLQFVYDLNDRPEQVLAYAAKYVDWAVDHMKVLIDAGAEIMYNCSDYCFNSGPFLSPPLFERFIVPFLRKQTDALKRAGAFVIKHTDGNIMPILELLVSSGAHCIHSLDPIAGVDLGEVKKRIGDQVCLMGNVDVRYLQMGPKEKIVESAGNALQAGMPGGGYIFSSCNSIFEGIPLQNYETMLEVRNRLGRYSRGQS